MKDWPWQKWVGRTILFVLSAIGFLIDQFPGVEIPWWVIILPAATQVAQWFIAWIPGAAWQDVLGKGILLLLSLVDLILVQLGITSELWIVALPLVGALAQWIISKAPPTKTITVLLLFMCSSAMLYLPLVMLA